MEPTHMNYVIETVWHDVGTLEIVHDYNDAIKRAEQYASRPGYDHVTVRMPDGEIIDFPKEFFA